MPQQAEAGAGLALQLCSSLKLTELQRVPTAVTAVREKSLVYIGCKGQVVAYDSLTNARHSFIAVPEGHTPTLLQAIPERGQLVIVCAEWTVFLHSFQSARTANVLNLGATKKSKLSHPLLACISGKQPTLLVTNMLKESLRSIHLSVAPDKKLQKELQPGNKLNLEKGKGAVALAAHPYARRLVVFTVNGELQFYGHQPGGSLEPLHQFTMLQEESRVATPLVANAHLSVLPHPSVPETALIFVILPKMGTFYIMTYTAEGEPNPLMRVAWPEIDYVLCVDIHMPLNSLIVMAGSSRGGGRTSMRAWSLVGNQKVPEAGFKLVPRACDQHVTELQVTPEASVVHKQPEWAQLWGGKPSWSTATTRTELLDLTAPVHRAAPAAAGSVVPRHAFILPNSDTCAVHFASRNAAQPAALPFATFRVLDSSHPSLLHPSGRVGSMHTTPQDWKLVTDDDGVAVHQFPYASYFLRGHELCAFVMAAQESKPVASVSPIDATSRLVNPDAMVYSRRQHSCLIFSSVLEDPAQRVFTHIDCGAQEQTEAWFGTGLMGVFLGPREDRFAVLESSALGADNIAVYDTATSFSTPEPAFRTYCELGMGDCVTGLWQGPPATHMLEDPQYDEDGNVVPVEETHGVGMVLLTTKVGALVLALLPYVEAVEEGADLQPCAAQYEMQLLEGEHVLQVAWNTLVPADSVGYPSHCLGAILTTYRVLLVSGNLRTLQSISVADAALGSAHAVTSLLWVGPALLMCSATGRVEQVHLTGRRTHLCSIGRSGTHVLSAAYGDRLVFLHKRGLDWVVVLRKAYVANAVMQAWLGLLATGHEYGTWANVRLEISALARHYALQDAVDVATADALLAAGCGDVLLRCRDALASAATSSVALAAASDSWEHAAEQVVREYEASAYAPCAPPEGSALRRTLVSVGLGAMSQGKWSCVERCLRAAGEHLLLMLLHSLQHNRPALKAASAHARAESAMRTMSMLLLAADSRIGLRQTLQKDWHLQRPLTDKHASTWELAERPFPKMRGVAPKERMVAAPAPGEEGPIAPLDTTSLAAHLGLQPVEILLNAADAAAPSAEPAAGNAPEGEEAGEDGDGAAEARVELTEEEKAQEAIRAQFLANLQGGLDSFMDDSEGEGDDGLIQIGDDDEDGSQQRKPKFRIEIKDASYSAGATGADVSKAVKNITLGPPGSMSMAAMQRKAAAPPVTSGDVWQDLGMQNPDAGGNSDPFAAFSDVALANSGKLSGHLPAVGAAAPVEAFDPFADPVAASAPQAAAAEATADAQAGAPQGAPACQAKADAGAAVAVAFEPIDAAGFNDGVQAMLAGHWDAATAHLSAAFEACSGGARKQVAQYLAVVRLLAQYGQLVPQAVCRLSRHVASFPRMQIDHVAFLVHDAVNKNIQANNFEWSASCMRRFVAMCESAGRMELAAAAQPLLQQTLQGGTGNVSVPEDEDVARFAAMVDEACSVDEVKLLASTLTS